MNRTPRRVLTAREVRDAMTQRGITSDDLATQAGIPGDVLAELLIGEVAFDVDQLHAVGRVLGVDAATLYGPNLSPT